MKLVTSQLPPLIDVPIPSAVREAEWFRDARLEDVVHLHAFPAYLMPVFSGKLFPALEMLIQHEEAGNFIGHPDVAGSSSGNFLKDVANAALAFPIRKVYAVVNRSLLKSKIDHMRTAGAEIEYAPDGVPATEYVLQFAEEHHCILLDQYTDYAAIQGHQVSMEHIAHGMRAKAGDAGFIFIAVAGTCSTLFAARNYLRRCCKGKVKVFGVASMSKSQKVPGSRTPEDLRELAAIQGFGADLYAHQKLYLDAPLITSVTKSQAYARNAELIHRDLITVGPTGALAETGFYHHLRDCVIGGTVDSLKNEHGKIAGVMFWMDGHLAYKDDPEYATFLKSYGREEPLSASAFS